MKDSCHITFILLAGLLLPLRYIGIHRQPENIIFPPGLLLVQWEIKKSQDSQSKLNK